MVTLQVKVNETPVSERVLSQDTSASRGSLDIQEVIQATLDQAEVCAWLRWVCLYLSCRHKASIRLRGDVTWQGVNRCMRITGGLDHDCVLRCSCRSVDVIFSKTSLLKSSEFAPRYR